MISNILENITLYIHRIGLAGKHQQGMAYLSMGDYKRALDIWKPLAESGHSKAQYDLGVMNYCALGVERNFAAAIELFLKAAAESNTDAEIFLGAIYSSGRGASQDIEKALLYYGRAKAKGNDRARELYSKLLSEGIPDPKRYAPDK